MEVSRRDPSRRRIIRSGKYCGHHYHKLSSIYQEMFGLRLSGSVKRDCVGYRVNTSVCMESLRGIKQYRMECALRYVAKGKVSTYTVN